MQQQHHLPSRIIRQLSVCCLTECYLHNLPNRHIQCECWPVGMHALPCRNILGYHRGERVECVPVVWGRDLLLAWGQRVHAVRRWDVRAQRWTLRVLVLFNRDCQ